MDSDGSDGARLARVADVLDPSRYISHCQRTTDSARLPSRAVARPRATRNHRPGNVSATNPVCSPCPVAKTMYCFPLYRNVIGTAVLTVGIGTAPTCLPVALSKA